MNCLIIRQQASQYLDRQLGAEANQEFLFHLNSCSDCFRYVGEIRQTAQLLQRLGPATPPPELAGEVLAKLNAARVCQPPAPGFFTTLHHLIFYGRPQFISYATGFVLTCLLFAGIIYGFKPKFVPQIEEALISNITPATPPLMITPAETLPSVQPSAAFYDLMSQAERQSSTKDLFVVADVSTEGHAQLIQLVDAPKSVSLERHVAAALKRASFKPAMKGGRPVNSRLLLLIQTIDVRG